MHRLLRLLVLLLAPTSGAADIDVSMLEPGMEFREIGPFRGGRSAAVAGVPGRPLTYYFGATGGGLWKTTDGGQAWQNVSDGFFGGSIGAVGVSEWDPNVIYVGGGEKTVRGNVSHGYGVWKSTDAGKTWRSLGLDDTRHIGRIRIHPRDPDSCTWRPWATCSDPTSSAVCSAAATAARPGRRSSTWTPRSAASTSPWIPTNPRILYASFWRVKRTPYSLESGGEGSSMWKSTDGGDTWTDITRQRGPAHLA